VQIRRQEVARVRGSKRRLRFIDGRDNAPAIVWAVAVAIGALLLAGFVGFLSP
jgi:hypothetical protein